jgi:hypothetical protein
MRTALFDWNVEMIGITCELDERYLGHSRTEVVSAHFAGRA